MKKTIALALAAAMTASALTGCGSGGKSETAQTTPAASETKAEAGTQAPDGGQADNAPSGEGGDGRELLAFLAACH